MSSSFKQKKMKTLATRKKTRKRRMEMGETHEDASGRLFQPPSRRDPRWKKPSVDDIVGDIAKHSVKKRKITESHKDAELDNEDGAGDEEEGFEIAPRHDSDGSVSAESEAEEPEPEADDDDHAASMPAEDLCRPPLRFFTSLEDGAAKAAVALRAIRRHDGRQKAKVLVMVDTRSLFKAAKKSMGVKAELVKSKSKKGMRSDNKVVMAYRNVAPLKTPMDRFDEVNEPVLKDFKSGKIPTVVAEDMSFYPYSELSVQHLIFLAKSPLAAINLDRSILGHLQVQVFVMNEPGTPISDEDMARLDQAFVITNPTA